MLSFMKRGFALKKFFNDIKGVVRPKGHRTTFVNFMCVQTLMSLCTIGIKDNLAQTLKCRADET